MTLEQKTTHLQIKADASGRIEGYASLFGEVDLGGDVVEAGAYSESLSEHRSRGVRIKMLWAHDPSQPIGVWDAVREDDTGLHVSGRILETVAKGRDVLELVRAGAVEGLSIGYRTLMGPPREGGGRLLKKLELWEVSLVTFPMLQSARVDAVKAAAMTEREMERRLTQDAGLSRTVARNLMGGGFDAVKSMRDAGSGGLEELVAHMRGQSKRQGE